MKNLIIENKNLLLKEFEEKIFITYNMNGNECYKMIIMIVNSSRCNFTTLKPNME